MSSGKGEALKSQRHPPWTYFSHCRSSTCRREPPVWLLQLCLAMLSLLSFHKDALIRMTVHLQREYRHHTRKNTEWVPEWRINVVVATQGEVSPPVFLMEPGPQCHHARVSIPHCAHSQLFHVLFLGGILKYHLITILSEQSCLAIQIRNGGFGGQKDPPAESISCGATVTYSCNEGFVLSGEAVLMCESSGQFNSSVPTCVDEFHETKPKTEMTRGKQQKCKQLFGKEKHSSWEGKSLGN